MKNKAAKAAGAPKKSWPPFASKKSKAAKGDLDDDDKDVEKADGDDEDDDDDKDEDDDEQDVDVKVEKADDDDDDDDDEDDDLNKKKSAKKSVVTAKSLRKAMAALSDLADGRSSREQVLARKLSKGTISKSERAEFRALIDDQEERPEQMSKALTDENHGSNAEAFDAAPFLQENAQLIAKSLDRLARRIQKSDDAQAEYNAALAKAVSGIADVSARLSDRMDAVESQPARAPKSAGVQGGRSVGALEKGFVGSQDQGQQLSKAQTMNVLEQMNKASQGTEAPGLSPGGSNLLTAIAQYENTNYLEQGIAQEVVQYVRQQRGAN